MGCHPGAGAALIRRGPGGFTLLEVLFALALATITLGVLLSSASSQVLRVGLVEPRYQSILTASRLLERAADRRQTGEASGRTEQGTWRLDISTVPADPRVDQLNLQVQGQRPGTSVTLQAWRLRARHQDPGARPESPGGLE